MKKDLPFYALGLISLFVLAIVFSFTIENNKKFRLHETENQLLEKISKRVQFIQPQDLAGKIMSGQELVIIDIRNPLNYRKGAIEGAVNIPFQQILAPKWESYFKDSSVTKILYCNLDIYANEAWMLLDQLGYRNIMVLEGGFDYWKENMETDYSINSNGASDEAPAYNYKKEMLKAGDGSESVKQENTPAVQINIKKKTGPKGGCG